MSPIILIIEDDKRIAQTIEKGLVEKDFRTLVAYDGQIGVKLANNNEVDLIILDVNLPLLNGYQVCKQIRERKPSIPILMLTALGETEDKIEGFEVGADDYIIKPFDFRELLARIQVFLRRSKGNVEANETKLKVADLEVNLDSKTVMRGKQKIDLTAKEFALLVCLMRNRGRVMSKIDLSEQVWDINFDTGTNVVEVYINFLRKKVDKDFEPKLIHTRTGMGYFLADNG